MSPAKRTNMKAEDRRNQLLDCATNLFFSKGFDSTTVQDIMQLANVSKGGFYHHFSSKEELMLAVFNRIADQSAAQMQAIVDDESMTSVEQLQAIYDLEGETLKTMPIESLIYTSKIFLSDANAGLHLVFNRTIARISIPILSELIRNGQTRGEFGPGDALATAKFIMFITYSYNMDLASAIDARGTDQADQAAAELKATIAVQFDALNLVLGLPRGTVCFGWPGMVDALMAPSRTG